MYFSLASFSETSEPEILQKRIKHKKFHHKPLWFGKTIKIIRQPGQDTCSSPPPQPPDYSTASVSLRWFFQFMFIF